ncbi:probable WRKY transcription factor 51 [Elaeis guineensis]|uniref:Probable WRKY transcription factor 51 n=1 Tax=Elaeis guineensis var. tenera TaxID=51953 RepID=A0A6I9S124_ELAGV|nr:probable WRKY transcription factor 51 [Elaeis guineensis]
MAALTELSDTTMLHSSLLPSNDSTSHACCDFFSANSFSQPVLECSDHIAFINEGLFQGLQLPTRIAAEELVHAIAPVDVSGESSEDSTTNKAMLCVGEMKRMKPDARCRIGFRMKSAVEILDDGFKWRKYGKKSVKNSPNPRNYYRCSSEGCSVKKRVERDPQDSDYVITTYEGVHNHISPGAVSYGRYQCISHSS